MGLKELIGIKAPTQPSSREACFSFNPAGSTAAAHELWDKYIHCRKAGLLKPFHTKRGAHRLHASTVQMFLVDTHIIKEYSGSRRQVEKEVHILRQLQHEGLTTYDFIVDQGSRISIVMEWAGAGLREHRRDHLGHYNEATVRHMAYQLTASLAYLHAKGIIHRDVKPDNIGVHVGSHSVQLFDWGEAVTLSDVHSAPDRELTQGVAVAGTPLFMAPEALNYLTRRGPQGSAGLRATLTTKLDIWGLGCVVFFMLSGRDVVSTDAGLELENLADLVDASDGIDLPDGCRASAAARDFLRCCLERDPELRSGAKQLLQHPWLAGATTMAELRAAKAAAARQLGGGAALVTVMAHESEGDAEVGRGGGVQLTRIPRRSDGGASSSSGFSSTGFGSSVGEEFRSSSFDEASVCTVSLRGLAPFGAGAGMAATVGSVPPGMPALSSSGATRLV